MKIYFFIATTMLLMGSCSKAQNKMAESNNNLLHGVPEYNNDPMISTIFGLSDIIPKV